MPSVTEPEAIRNKKICHKCISNDLFSVWIKENADTVGCNYNSSHRRAKSVNMNNFAIYVDGFFQSNYLPGRTEQKYDSRIQDVYYDQLGDTLDVCLCNELGSDD